MGIIYFKEEHEKFRSEFRQFLEVEVMPFIDKWEEEEQIPKEIWKKMGDHKFLGLGYPEYSQGREGDFFHRVVLIEEVSKVHSGGFGASLGIPQLALPYMESYGSDFIKQKYLSKVISGEKLCSIAITEPVAGSDVAGIRTSARLEKGHYIVNGSKTFITNGFYADFYLTVVKTLDEQANSVVSLLIIDADASGITKRKIKKMGWHASDTAEIGFTDVKVPKENLVGQEGKGFLYLMSGLQFERLFMALVAMSDMKRALNYTCKQLERCELGESAKHRIARMLTQLAIDTNYLYRCCEAHNSGAYIVKECSIAKLSSTEHLTHLLTDCILLLEEKGLNEKGVLARMLRDSRIGTIGGGTSEIMAEIIAKITIDETVYEKPN